MKTKLTTYCFGLASILMLAIACKKQNTTVIKDLQPKQDVFAENYSEFSKNGITDQVFTPVGIDNKKAALGRLLFYDARLSLSGAVACASCHKQELAFSDNVAFSRGFKGLGTTLNALPLSNLETDRVLFWQSRASSLENLSLMPVANHLEMGFLQVEDVITRLGAIDLYRNNFLQVFGALPSQKNVSESIAEFIKSLRSVNSKYDQGYAGSASASFSNFTQLENFGKTLFFNVYNCNSCHGPVSKIQEGWGELVGNIGLPMMNNVLDSMRNEFVKVPSLRNVELTGPYMHDGRFSTLDEVLDHYSNGIELTPALSWSLRTFDPVKQESQAKKFNISDDEKKAIIAFLLTLTDNTFTKDRRFSNPF